MARRTERDKEIRQVHSSLLTRSFNSTNLFIQEKNLHATDHYINILFYYKKTHYETRTCQMFSPTALLKGKNRRLLKVKQLLQTERYPFY